MHWNNKHHWEINNYKYHGPFQATFMPIPIDNDFFCDRNEKSTCPYCTDVDKAIYYHFGLTVVFSLKKLLKIKMMSHLFGSLPNKHVFLHLEKFLQARASLQPCSTSLYWFCWFIALLTFIRKLHLDIAVLGLFDVELESSHLHNKA